MNIISRFVHFLSYYLVCIGITVPLLLLADKNKSKKYCPIISTTQRVVTYISPRSQSTNAARELVGWEYQINKFKTSGVYGSFNVTSEITKSFRPERIGQCLFGDDAAECQNTLTISGTRTTERIPNRDWLADYFGLPTNFKSTVCFRPRVNNFLIDFNFFIGFSEQLRGLYFRVHAPLVRTTWDLNMTEHIHHMQYNDYEPGYFNDVGIPREDLLNNFTAFISGEKAPNGENLLFQKLSFAKMDPCSRSITRVSEIQATLGLNPWEAEWYHAGFNLRLAIPTGNRPQGEFLFEPIVGNGHHWELGAGISTHVKVWHNEETQESLALFFDANFMHLFRTSQRRSFDLKEKPNSRYMPVQKFGTPIANNLTGQKNDSFISPNAQFKNEVTPLANLTTFDIDVSVSVQADLAFLFSYAKDKLTFSFGYGVWKQSCENITIKNTKKIEENTWTLKGDAYVIGFIGQEGSLPVSTPIALSATENKATINAGKNFPKKGTDQENQIQEAQTNCNIDNKTAAFAGSNQQLVTSPNSQENQINTSIQPQFVTFSDIDINSARTRSTAQKIFGHVSRQWNNHITSYLGFGAEIDFGRHSGPTSEIFEDECVNCALSYWGVWLKGGLSF